MLNIKANGPRFLRENHNNQLETMTTSPPDINVEEIMQQIRAEILAQRAAQTGSEPIVSAQGKRFSPEFYEHLYQAGLAYDQIKPPMLVTKINIPIIGTLVEKVRTKLHELVLFYVNQVAVQQIQVNTHLLKALNVLSAELEREAEARNIAAQNIAAQEITVQEAENAGT